MSLTSDSRPAQTESAEENCDKSAKYRSAYAGFGELDRNPEVDLGKDLIELLVAGTVLEVPRDCLEPQQRALIEAAGQQPELELIKRIKRPAAIFHSAAAPFGRLFDALKGDQRVDAAKRAQRNRWILGMDGFRFGKTEGGAARGTPRPRSRRGSKGRAVGSMDAHTKKVIPYG